MKKLLLILLLSIIATEAYAESVRGYYRKDGTYVNSYERSAPNGTVTDNYSYKNNTNPYTGQTGANSYIHDTTSPNYQGPDRNGNSGHSNGYNGYYR